MEKEIIRLKTNGKIEDIYALKHTDNISIDQNAHSKKDKKDKKDKKR